MSLVDRIHGHPQLKNLMLPVTALFCSLLWGSAFPVIKYAYRYMDDSSLDTRLAFAGLRFALAGFVLLLFVNRKREHYRNAPKRLLYGVLFFQTVLQYFFFYWGLSLTNGVVAAILVATSSFWWVLLAPLFDRSDHINLKQGGVLLIGFLGVCICVYRPEGIGGGDLWGAALILCTAFCGSLGSVLVRGMGGRLPATFITGFSLAGGGTILMLMAPGQVLEIVTRANPPVIMATLWLAFISACAFSLWYLLVTLYDIARLGVYRFLIPVCGAVESALFIPGEQLEQRMVFGGLVVLLAVRMLERQQRANQSLSNITSQSKK